MATLWSVAALLIGTHGSGANVETVNKWEGTPLHEACNVQRKVTPQPPNYVLLVEHGANAEPKDEGGRTPLDDGRRPSYVCVGCGLRQWLLSVLLMLLALCPPDRGAKKNSFTRIFKKLRLNLLGE